MAGVGAAATPALAAGEGLMVCCSQALSCSRSLQIPQAGVVVLPLGLPPSPKLGQLSQIINAQQGCPLETPGGGVH